ncbi:MAG: hypothetical protein JWL70_1118, partial [Acidimicrobiia bacterium]|nr:hypothetical protein [Acidimicrobiia bacterium]
MPILEERTAGPAGAWGLRWGGAWLDDTARHLLLDSVEWPLVDVSVREQILPDGLEPEAIEQELVWSHDRLGAVLPAGGRLAVQRVPLVAELVLPELPVAECIVQPYLASAAAL